MDRKLEEAESPFELKKKGHFGDALAEYARQYVKSLDSGDGFIADVCFDQVFDICLLAYLREGDRFETKSHLLRAIERRIRDVLSQQGADGVEFKQRLGSCNRRLFPRGRSTGVFSVDPKWLLKTAQAQG